MFSLAENGKGNGKDKSPKPPNTNAARSFTFRELASATRNFREMNLIGEGGFGRVYKGRLESGQASCNQIIAICRVTFWLVIGCLL